jgi:hypothetical protein
MAGFGSGTTRTPRPYLDACPAVSVLKLYHDGHILPGANHITLSIDGSEPVTIALTYHCPPQYRWARGIPAFVCPTCERSVRYLYVRNGEFGCRQCLRLAYSSRHLRRWSPALHRVASVRRKLGADPHPFGPLPPRPDGKGRLRYDRLIAQLAIYENRVLAALGSTIEAVQRRAEGMRK